MWPVAVGGLQRFDLIIILLSKSQPTLPFHKLEIIPSSHFTCLKFYKYLRVNNVL